jgi:4-hydroxy-3-methylbut-2-enyl diphosphate reductase
MKDLALTCNSQPVTRYYKYMQIEKSSRIGFCFGVRRALEILEKTAAERGGVESLGEVVHNDVVMHKLAKSGVRVRNSIADVSGKAVALGAHGVPPVVFDEIKVKNIEIIDTTCPIVRRAQRAAEKLYRSGFYVIIFGDAEHAEVKGILGWARDKGMATFDEKPVISLEKIPARIGVLSQTTQVPSRFIEFTGKILDAVYRENSEIRIIDTLCPDLKMRQSEALRLAERVDIMLVVGGRNSANTLHLAELCATAVETHKIAGADELDHNWFNGKNKVGITAGTSTADETVEEVENWLKNLASRIQ